MADPIRLVDKQPVSLLARDARPDTPGITRRYPRREYSKALTKTALIGTRGRPGLIEEMIAGFPAIASGTREAENQAASAAWEVGEPEDSTPAEVAFAEDVDQVLREMTTDGANHVGDLGEAMAHLTAGRWYGHHVCELSWVEDRSALNAMRLEAYRIHPSAIDAFILDPVTGALLRIEQWTEIASVDIDAENLVVVSFGGAWPTGQSTLRPLAFWYEWAKQTAISASERAVHEAGVVVLRRTQPTPMDDDDNAERRRDILVTYSSSEGMRVVDLPYGQDAGVEYPSGTASDPTVVLNWVRNEANATLNSSMKSLGISSSTGARALGEEMEVSDRGSLVDALNSQASLWSRQVFTWLARQLPGRNGRPYATASGELLVRLPSLTVRADTEVADPTAIVERVEKVLGLGLVEVTPALSQWLAELAGIPADVVAESLPLAPVEHVEEVEVAPEPAEVEASDLALADGDGPHIIIDVNGEEFSSCKPQDELTLAESVVAWAEIDRAREIIDDDRIRQLGELAEKHRGELVLILGNQRVTDDPLVQAEVARVTSEFERRYRAIYDDWARSAQTLAERAGEDERERQQAMGGTAGDSVDPTALRPWVAEQQRGIDASAAGAAASTAQRVQREVSAAWEMGADVSEFETRQTPAGLGAEARAAVNRAEGMGRVRSATSAAPNGSQLRGAIRTSVRDRNRCDVCASRDGGDHPDVGRWDFPEDLDAFMTDSAAHVPDPQCLGRGRCRCGFLMIWGPPAR